MKKISQETYEIYQEVNKGFCTECKDFTCEDIEAEAEAEICPECDGETVVGLETAIHLDEVEVVEDEEIEDEDYDGGEFV